ncbi:hypothetical protein PSP6_80098 [Paraburkholderia tropica]|nr:hypothetical protein PSP6_80098 [Paraburkholderia tropica]
MVIGVFGQLRYAMSAWHHNRGLDNRMVTRMLERGDSQEFAEKEHRLDQWRQSVPLPRRA